MRKIKLIRYTGPFYFLREPQIEEAHRNPPSIPVDQYAPDYTRLIGTGEIILHQIQNHSIPQIDYN